MSRASATSWTRRSRPRSGSLRPRAGQHQPDVRYAPRTTGGRSLTRDRKLERQGSRAPELRSTPRRRRTAAGGGLTGLGPRRRVPRPQPRGRRGETPRTRAGQTLAGATRRRGGRPGPQARGAEHRPQPGPTRKGHADAARGPARVVQSAQRGSGPDRHRGSLAELRSRLLKVREADDAAGTISKCHVGQGGTRVPGDAPARALPSAPAPKVRARRCSTAGRWWSLPKVHDHRDDPLLARC